MTKNRATAKSLVDRTGRSVGGEQHVRLPFWLLKSPAWRDLNCVARGLLVELGLQFHGSNNGQIGLSVRTAAMALHVASNTAMRAFNDLEERGFIRLARDSSFNQKNRMAREWTLTQWPLGAALATKDFMRWQAPAEKQNTVSNHDTDSINPCHRDRAKAA